MKQFTRGAGILLSITSLPSSYGIGTLGAEAYRFVDLLVDLKVYPDGTHEVLDVEELEEAIAENLITIEQKEDALNKLSELLELVKNNQFPPMKEII